MQLRCMLTFAVPALGILEHCARNIFSQHLRCSEGDVLGLLASLSESMESRGVRLHLESKGFVHFDYRLSGELVG